jgi:hypothetical protein
MACFVAQRVRRVFVHRVDAPASSVFPLLCPVREREWVEGWEAEVVSSASGLVEDHCVFTTDVPAHGRATWVVSTYDPSAHRIGFTVFHPRGWVERLDVVVVGESSSTSRVDWTRTYTPLDEDGRALLGESTGPALDARMARLHASLRQFLATGSGEGDTLIAAP